MGLLAINKDELPSDHGATRNRFWRLSTRSIRTWRCRISIRIGG